MKNKVAFSIILSLFFIASRGSDTENITARIWLFQGKPMEGGGVSGKVEILSSPQLAVLKSLVGGPENKFNDALTDALLDIGDLKILDDLFLFKKTWDKGRPSISSSIIKSQLAFRIDLIRIQFSPPQLTLRAVVSRNKEGALHEYKDEKRSARDAFLATQDESRMVRIVDQEFSVVIGDPVVVAIPYKDAVYYMGILFTPEEKVLQVPSSPKVEQPQKVALVRAPRPVQMVMPSYPEELRRSGVKGDVGLQVTIDEKGNVKNVKVRRPLHPYLDYLSVQAFLQWTFDPVLQKGKPVRAAFDFTLRFDPSLYSGEAVRVEAALISADQPAEVEIRRIIEGCAEYGRKLAEQGLFFTCEESIRETNYHLMADISHWDLSSYFDIESAQVSERLTVTEGTPVQIMDPSRTEITRYVCDYQLTRKNGEVEERRIVLKENGRKTLGWAKLLEEKRFSIINPIFHSLKIFDRDRQALFSYQLLGEEEIRGRKVYVIRAMRRSGEEGDIRSAKIWADKKSFQILKSEIRGVPLEGYEDVLRDSVVLNIMPFFLTTHEYKIEKNGIIFPERTTVLVGYPSPGRPILKYKAELDYEKYKFFSVETGHEIIK